MLNIISKRKFRFYKPGADVLESVERSGIGSNAIKYEAAVFETNGTGELQQAPDWIKQEMGPRPRGKEWPAHYPDVDINAQNILTWNRAEKDGHLMEVVLMRSTEESSALAKQAEVKAVQLAKEIASGEKDETRPVKTSEELQKMSKDELLDHAKKEHNLELSDSLSKTQLIANIKSVQQQ